MNIEILAATIYYRKKDAMRVAMKNAKTVIDDQDRARKAAVMGEVVASNKAKPLSYSSDNTGKIFCLGPGTT